MSLGEIPGGNLRAFYKLEDVNDSSGNGFTLTNVGSVSFNPGKFSNAADFGTTGTTKGLTYSGNVLSSTTPSNLSVSFWFILNTTSTPTNGILFQLCSVANGGGSAFSGIFWNVYYNISAGNMVISIRFGGGTIQTITIPASTSVWHFAQFVYSTTGNAYNGRINTDYINYNANATQASWSGQTVRLYIGGSGSANQAWVKIDEFIISEILYSQANGTDSGDSERYKYYTQAKGRTSPRQVM